VKPLIAERLTTEAELAALEPEWAALAQRVTPRLPFFEPLWNLTWWKHYRENRSTVRHSLRVTTLRRPGGELVGVAPMMITERPARGPARVRLLQFFGADPNLTELRGVLCLPEAQSDVYRTLLGHLRRAKDEWDFMRFTGVPAGGDVRAQVAAEGSVRLDREVPDYFLHPTGTWETFKAGLSRNIKESLRKCTNAPKRDGVELTFRVVTDKAELPKALDTFFALHENRSQATDTITHKNVFAEARGRDFLRDYLLSLEPAGAARIYQLRHGERVVATRVAFLLGNDLYLYFSGYDLEYSKYSVMTTCVAEAIRDAIGSGIGAINLSMGNDVSKTRWSPTEVMFHDLVWISPTTRGALMHRAYETLDEARTNPDSFLGKVVAQVARRRA